MILTCSNLKKEFNDEVLFEHGSFQISDREKIAIVGNNGTGKSTLIKILLGEIDATEGTFAFAKDLKIGYLSQKSDLNTDSTIWQEILETKSDVIKMEKTIREMEETLQILSNEDEIHSLMEKYHLLLHQFDLLHGYSYKSEMIGILKGLGFQEEEFEQKIATLSGGQKTRVSLSKILIQNPDLIILDEPTNHLDLSAIKWLENFLSLYSGAIILISHDRYFLNKIVTKIVEIDFHKISVYKGNYTSYAKQKELRRISEINAYLNQQKEIKHQEEVITKLKSFNREKSIKRAESREKQLNKIELLQKPEESNAEMHLSLTPQIQSGNDVLQVLDLTKSFDQHLLLNHISFSIFRGEHIGIIGNNGCGKTTLLKILLNLVEFEEGTIHLGTNVLLGYYDQEHQKLSEDKTIFAEISDSFPDLTNTQIRNLLAAFMFTKDDVLKVIRSLSGGEKGRVSLAKLMLSKANFLLLDEPTNHLDMSSKEILENAIKRYTGTVLFVSHDRYFINEISDKIFEIDQTKLTIYQGNYNYYLDKKDAATISFETNQSTTRSDTVEKIDWQQQKEQNALKRKLENTLTKAEQKINSLEQEITVLQEEINLPSNATNVQKLTELTEKLNSLECELETTYSEWEKLSEELI